MNAGFEDDDKRKRRAPFIAPIVTFAAGARSMGYEPAALRMAFRRGRFPKKFLLEPPAGRFLDLEGLMKFLKGEEDE